MNNNRNIFTQKCIVLNAEITFEQLQMFWAKRCLFSIFLSICYYCYNGKTNNCCFFFVFPSFWFFSRFMQIIKLSSIFGTNFKSHCVVLTHSRVKIQLKLRSTFSQFYCNVLAILILVFVDSLFFFFVITVMGVNFLLRTSPSNVSTSWTVLDFIIYHLQFSFLFFVQLQANTFELCFQCFVFKRALECLLMSLEMLSSDIAASDTA